MDIKRHFTLGLEGPCSLESIFSHWWKMLEDIPLHFIQEVEGLMRPRKFEWMENLHGILHHIQWIMFHSLTGFASSHLKEMGLTQTQETMTLQNLTSLE